MNVLAINAELGERLSAIPGLQVLPWGAQSARPPTLVVPMPERITFDITYERGSDMVEVEFMVLVSMADMQSAHRQLMRYGAPRGPLSVKELADHTPDNPWRSCDDFMVKYAEPDVIRLGDKDYLGLVFTAEAIGNGKGE